VARARGLVPALARPVHAWRLGVEWGWAKTGAVDGDNIVWGTMSDGDNIVWGTAADGDNIVWGTLTRSQPRLNLQQNPSYNWFLNFDNRAPWMRQTSRLVDSADSSNSCTRRP